MTTRIFGIAAQTGTPADSTFLSGSVQASAIQRRPRTSNEIRWLAQVPLGGENAEDKRKAVHEVFEEILIHKDFSEPALEPRLLLDITDVWVGGNVWGGSPDVWVDCLRAIPASDRANLGLGPGWQAWLLAGDHLKQVLAEIRRLEAEDKPSMLCVLLSVAVSASDSKNAIRVARAAGALDRKSYSVVMAHGIELAKALPDKGQYGLFKTMLRRFVKLFSEVELEHWGWDNHSLYAAHQMRLMNGIGHLSGESAGKLLACWSRWQPEVDPEYGGDWPTHLVNLVGHAYPHAIPAFLESMNSDWKCWAQPRLNKALQHGQAFNHPQ